MTDQDKVRSVVARFFNVPEASVTDNYAFPAERLHGSVGRATFHAAIKRMAGVDLLTAFNAATFGELFNPVAKPGANGTSVPPTFTNLATAKPVETSAALDSGVGIDIEHIDHLPAAADPWTEPFYVENFTKAEIAYCQRQQNPRESFCGLWCAKEAAMKCGPEFFNLRPLQLEIMHDAQGRPFLTIIRDGQAVAKRDCHLSISHSHGFSVAVFVACGNSKTAAPENSSATPNGPTDFGSSILAWLALGLAGLSLLLWLLTVLNK